ncbi:hypothetical protein [Mumia zhuanghuii]|uniref:hypothetical protein n=1 Tax=Mumia zhuanghuii TaxID=2585211 RepID=UPI00129C6A5F|nr:hypothetical protein [Mumia zhuanghuii]
MRLLKPLTDSLQAPLWQCHQRLAAGQGEMVVQEQPAADMLEKLPLGRRPPAQLPLDLA